MYFATCEGSLYLECFQRPAWIWNKFHSYVARQIQKSKDMIKLKIDIPLALHHLLPVSVRGAWDVSFFYHPPDQSKYLL